LYKLTLGFWGAVLVVLAAALWVRAIKHPWARVLPTRRLQKQHILFGSVCVPLILCHMGARWPGSTWSWVLMGVFALVIGSGVTIYLIKKWFYEMGKFVEQNIKVKPDPSGAK